MKKLWTIWLLPLVPYAIKKWYTEDEIANFVAQRLPDRVMYWATVRMIQWATKYKTEEEVPNVTVQELLDQAQILAGPYMSKEAKTDGQIER